MIDRKSRDALAIALRHYCAGLITNDDLDEVLVDWRDRGAVAVKQMSWQLYSDQEYLWPEYSFIQIVNWPMNLLTFGWWETWKKRRWDEFLEAGDFSVWPFCDKAGFEQAKISPRLMAGSYRH